MADNLSKDKRSKIMRSIKSKNTKPEITVRKILTKLGYRYRLHAKDLPGKPDIVFKTRKKAIFIHGCFWHGHDICMKDRVLGDFWNKKLQANKARDLKSVDALTVAGWETLTLWECELKAVEAIENRLSEFLGNTKLQN